MKYELTHADRACEIVDLMIDDVKSKMKELGLKSLRIENEPRIIIYRYEGPSFIYVEERTVHGLVANGEDDLLIKSVPYSSTVKFTNDCVTGKEDIEVTEDDFDGYDYIHADSEDVEYFSLLYLDDDIYEAFREYENAAEEESMNE